MRNRNTLSKTIAIGMILVSSLLLPYEARAASLVVTAQVSADGALLTGTGVHVFTLSSFDPGELDKQWDLTGTLRNSVLSGSGTVECADSRIYGYGPARLSCVTSITYGSCEEAMSVFRGSSYGVIEDEEPTLFSPGVYRTRLVLAFPAPLHCQPDCI